MTASTAPYDRAPSRAVRFFRANERWLLGVLGFVVISLIWEQAASAGIIKRSLLSAPSLIWKVAVEDFGSGMIYPEIAASLQEFFIGFLFAVGIGIPLGLAIGMFKRVDDFVSMLLYGIYSTPKAAVAPLIILVLGVGLESKVMLVFLLTFFSVVVSMVSGVHAVSEKHLDIAKSFGASAWLRFRAVILPTTIPFMLTGMRIATGRALVGVVVAEELAANEGIGRYIEFYGTFLDTSRVMLGVVLLGVFGIALGELVKVIEKRFEKWRPERR